MKKLLEIGVNLMRKFDINIKDNLTITPVDGEILMPFHITENWAF